MSLIGGQVVMKSRELRPFDLEMAMADVTGITALLRN
jgi:hypothetical protein